MNKKIREAISGLVANNILEKKAVQLSLLDNPAVVIPTGAGVGALLGGLYGYQKDMEFATPQERRDRAVVNAIRGGILGGGLAATHSIMGLNIGPRLQ